VILELAGCGDVRLIPSQDYERMAKVPKHVALRNFCGWELGITMRPWREALRTYLTEYHGE